MSLKVLEGKMDKLVGYAIAPSFPEFQLGRPSCRYGIGFVSPKAWCRVSLRIFWFPFRQDPRSVS